MKAATWKWLAKRSTKWLANPFASGTTPARHKSGQVWSFLSSKDAQASDPSQGVNLFHLPDQGILVGSLLLAFIHSPLEQPEPPSPTRRCQTAELLHSDRCLWGMECGAIFGKHWLQWPWSEEWSTMGTMAKELAPIVLCCVICSPVILWLNLKQIATQTAITVSSTEKCTLKHTKSPKESLEGNDLKEIFLKLSFRTVVS